jgi:hypothetical protein
MDDVVAVAVRHGKSEVVHFLTWGRIFDVVDPTEVENLVEKFAPAYGLTKIKSVRVLQSLQGASSSPYFYEGILHFAHSGIPFGTTSYPKWRAKVKKEMQAGRHLYFCGRQETSGKAARPARLSD